jgi:hypothetical protein
MCKAKNASHIRTASTAAAEYPKAKTTNRRLHKIFDTTAPVHSGASLCLSLHYRKLLTNCSHADSDLPELAHANSFFSQDPLRFDSIPTKLR